MQAVIYSVEDTSTTAMGVHTENLSNTISLISSFGINAVITMPAHTTSAMGVVIYKKVNVPLSN